MERRNFIKNTILAAGALSLPLVGNTACAGRASTTVAAGTFKKSIMWGTVGIEGTVLDKCRAIQQAGFQGIEPNSHMNRSEVIDAAKTTGLSITDVCCSTHWGKPLSHPDAAVRKEGVDGAIVAIEDAAAYGCDAMLLVPGAVSESVSYDDCWRLSVEGIRKLMPVAEKLKVQICVENVWNNFLLSPMEAAYYVDQFQSEWVKFYFDCGNIVIYGWPEQWIKILGNRIGRIHIKEFNKDTAAKEGNRTGFGSPLTEGTVNWAAVMAAMRLSYSQVWLATEIGANKTIDELKDLNNRFDRVLAM